MPASTHGSILVREILATLLRVHVDTIVTAASVSEARDRLAEHRDLNLVLCDVVLPDGDGFKVLEHIRELSSPRPQVILRTACPPPKLTTCQILRRIESAIFRR